MHKCVKCALLNVTVLFCATNVTKDFLLNLNWDRFGACDCYTTRGHTAQQHTPTGHIYLSQPEQGKVRLLTGADF